jgi:hypothetical protein
MENNMSNFMFTDGAAPISDGLRRFLLRSRTDMSYTQQKKHRFTINETEIVQFVIK